MLFSVQATEAPELMKIESRITREAVEYNSGYELQPTFGYYRPSAFLPLLQHSQNQQAPSMATFKTSKYNLQQRLFILTYTFTTY